MIGSNRLRAAVLSTAIMLAGASRVAAQTEGNISVGVDYGVDLPVSDEMEQREAFGISFRLPRPSGLSAAWDFGVIRADLNHLVQGANVELGEFSTRPVLVGAAYSIRKGRIELTTIATGGVSFSKLELSELGKLAIRSSPGLDNERAEGNAVIAFQPKLTLWVDLSRWFAVGANASYLFQRPTITLTSSDGVVERFTAKADLLRLSAGIVVKAF